MNRSNLATIFLTANLLAIFPALSLAERETYRSHPPMRPLPKGVDRPLQRGPTYFVDPVRGDDANQGNKDRPWKTVARAVRRLSPGDLLVLRGGVYYEHVQITWSGTKKKPITIRAYPGEIAVLDGGLREFAERPKTAWQSYQGGVGGEYISTRKYSDLGGRPEQTNLLGHFADSMVPLHGYRYRRDLQSDNMFWKSTIRSSKTEGIYCGPGLWYDTKTGYIHVRLAHTTLKGLGRDNYKGETDPRKVPLVVAGFKGGSTFTIQGAKHLIVQDLVVRGSRDAAVDIVDCEDLRLDGLTVYGGRAPIQVKDTWGMRIVNTACRGIAAPWTFRGSLKYRAIEARLFSASGWRVSAKGNRDFEIAYSEFTDCVDGVFIGNVRRVHFHHNLVDNVSDDGIFLTANTAFDGSTPGGGHVLSQNLFSRCLTTFAFGAGHGRQKAIASGRQTGKGASICRNVFDFRRPVMYYQPTGPEAPQELISKGRIGGDHGSPTWEPMHIYHNTILDDQQRGSAYGALGLGDHMGKGAKRRVFNNIVVQLNRPVSLNLPPAATDFQADGNLFWSMTAGKEIAGNANVRKKFDQIVEASKKTYSPGWTANDRFGNPQFVRFVADWRKDVDLSLRKNSPAINAGVALPKSWQDPLRNDDVGKPDCGALPLGMTPWRVGVRGRLTIFGGPTTATSPVKFSPRPFATHPVAKQWTGKPVAIVEGYPAFDRPLIEFALRQQGAPVDVIERKWLEPEQYGKYGMVVLVGNLLRAKVDPARFRPQDIAHLHRFVQQGGVLFVHASARDAFSTTHGRAFLTKLFGSRPSSKFAMSVLQPNHPWVNDLGNAPTWLTPRGRQPLFIAKGENVIGSRQGGTVLCRIRAGKGQFVYLGWTIDASRPRRDVNTMNQERIYSEQSRIVFAIVRDLFRSVVRRNDL